MPENPDSPENPDIAPDLPGAAAELEVRTYFVRGRNALLARAWFEPLYVDYYLHLADLRLQLSPVIDTLMKEGLAAMALHMASRPWAERHAWTVNFQHPLANIFVAGDNTTGSLTGRAFTENVKSAEHQLFYAQVHKAGADVRQSTVDFPGSSFFTAAEAFYTRSEQRMGRLFEHAPEDYVLLTAQPQCDLPWLEGLTLDALRTIDKDEELSLLEVRRYHWECGCNTHRLYAALEPHIRSGMDALFHGEEALRADCPRCGRHYLLTREGMEAWIAEQRAAQAAAAAAAQME